MHIAPIVVKILTIKSDKKLTRQLSCFHSVVIFPRFSNKENMIAVFNENIFYVNLNDKEIRLKHT